jgi:hypothetical protein
MVKMYILKNFTRLKLSPSTLQSMNGEKEIGYGNK